jgi:Chromosome condensation complex Condensin, subunit G
MVLRYFCIESRIVAAEEKIPTEDDDEDEDTTASRFTARLLNFLIKGFLAKDKSIRYRVLHTVAEMVSHLGEIE